MAEHTDNGVRAPGCGAYRWGSWCCLWRHRYEPAVCVSRVACGRTRSRCRRSQRARRALVDVLVTHHRDHDQVPGDRDAGRQRWRRRHPRTRFVGHRQAALTAPTRSLGAVRHGAPVRRRHDHAGDLGAVGSRRTAKSAHRRSTGGWSRSWRSSSFACSRFSVVAPSEWAGCSDQ